MEESFEKRLMAQKKHYTVIEDVGDRCTALLHQQAMEEMLQLCVCV